MTINCISRMMYYRLLYEAESQNKSREGLKMEMIMELDEMIYRYSQFEDDSLISDLLRELLEMRKALHRK